MYNTKNYLSPYDPLKIAMNHPVKNYRRGADDL